ncbi:hypothetical protein EV681_3646 [Advenella incenata]|uniref:Uncharacterized protein n=1 Tax=Advenella incenata TaxID=267800 RepID=A0A4Q7V8V5_9BURK|nr:hypothetical protein EV681_3646 [Advenella incenata]
MHYFKRIRRTPVQGTPFQVGILEKPTAQDMGANRCNRINCKRYCVGHRGAIIARCCESAG